MLDHDGLSMMCLHYGCIHVSPESLSGELSIIIIFLGKRISHFTHHKIGSRSRGQIIHPVSPVDVHDLTYRTQSMSRIKVPIPVHILTQSPVVIIFGFRKITLQDIVNVGSFPMEDITENPLSSHIQGHEFEKIITTVLQD